MRLLNVVLIHPEIPQNTGNISRLCVGADAALHIVRPAGFELSERAVRRAGLDHWQDLDLHMHADLDAFLDRYGTHRLVLTSKRASLRYTEFHYKPGDFLVFGCETSGLPESMLEMSVPRIFIPIPGPVRSINLSNAVAIVLYEAIRQLGADGMETTDRHPAASHRTDEEYYVIRWNKARRRRSPETGHRSSP